MIIFEKNIAPFKFKLALPCRELKNKFYVFRRFKKFYSSRKLITAIQITGECEINNMPTTFLADTGCQQTIIHKNTIDLNNNEWGYIKPFNTNVLTAEGQKANIIGIKQCKIQIGQWTGCHNILISNNLIKKCIIGIVTNG